MNQQSLNEQIEKNSIKIDSIMWFIISFVLHVATYKINVCLHAYIAFTSCQIQCMKMQYLALTETSPKHYVSFDCFIRVYDCSFIENTIIASNSFYTLLTHFIKLNWMLP